MEEKSEFPCPECGEYEMYGEQGKPDFWCRNCDAGPYEIVED